MSSDYGAICQLEETCMLVATTDSLIERGLKAAEYRIFEQNKIWARYASEKPDVAISLMGAIRQLHSRTPVDRKTVRARDRGGGRTAIPHPAGCISARPLAV